MKSDDRNVCSACVYVCVEKVDEYEKSLLSVDDASRIGVISKMRQCEFCLNRFANECGRSLPCPL